MDISSNIQPFVKGLQNLWAFPSDSIFCTFAQEKIFRPWPSLRNPFSSYYIYDGLSSFIWISIYCSRQRLVSSNAGSPKLVIVCYWIFGEKFLIKYAFGTKWTWFYKNNSNLEWWKLGSQGFGESYTISDGRCLTFIEGNHHTTNRCLWACIGSWNISGSNIWLGAVVLSINYALTCWLEFGKH